MYPKIIINRRRISNEVENTNFEIGAMAMAGSNSSRDNRLDIGHRQCCTTMAKRCVRQNVAQIGWLLTFLTWTRNACRPPPPPAFPWLFPARTRVTFCSFGGRERVIYDPWAPASVSVLVNYFRTLTRRVAFSFFFFWNSIAGETLSDFRI